MDDGKAAKRLERRREIIRTKMFPNFSACQISNPDDLVWVESTPLLQFMSCRDRLQERLEHRNDRAVFQHHDLLCSHEPPGLPPRVARKGKLLPKLAYEAYVAALREEQRALLGGNNDAKCFSECLILPTDNLICKECSDDYGFELLGKRQKIVKFKDLYDALDPKEMNFSLDLGVDYETYGDRCDRYAYIVSRKFITWFRNKVAHLMKQAACSAANATSVDCSNEFLALRAENVAEGLDGLDLSELEVGSLQNVGPGEVDDESISSRVNGPITCTSFVPLRSPLNPLTCCLVHFCRFAR